MARKPQKANFSSDVSALAERIRAEVEASEPKPVLDFGPWCMEVSPSMRWDWAHLAFIRAKLAPRIKALEVCLQASLAGRPLPDDHQQPKHLIFSVPPRHGKSEQITIRLPAYVLELWPQMRVILAAYNAFLVQKFSRRCRKIAAQRVALNKERNAAEEWETTAEGGVRAVGVGGGVTGTGGHLIIIDDPVKSREEAESEAYREKVWDWFTDDLYTRLEPGGIIILIMTRWHEDDLAGRIQKSEFADQFEVINLPAEAEFEDPLGREPGEPLCPDRFTSEALAKLKTVLGRSYFSLYQGHPADLEGDIIKPEWFSRYATGPGLHGFERIVQSWDTAQKAAQRNDFSVCTTWGIVGGLLYLLEVWRERAEYPKLRAAFIAQKRKWNPHLILVEDKGHGTALIQEARNQTGFNVKAMEPDGDKATRMSIESGAIEGGKVVIPLPAEKGGPSAPWLADFEDECAKFPNVKHDDQVDSMSQFLKWHRESASRKSYAQIDNPL